MRNKFGLLIQCDKADCEYEWYYTGSMKLATCPSCHLNVRVKENIVNRRRKTNEFNK